jgi:glucose/arabinose dehydrogenase
VTWGELAPTPFLDIHTRVSCCGERGLLSLAVHPDYASNGQFFVDYTDTGGNTVVSRFRVSANPDVADPDSEQVILRQAQPFPNHNGGLVRFGPDGYLYIGFGDGGSAGDPQGNAQNRLTWLGKLLRVDVDGGAPYAIPPDNPFAGTAGALGEIWALGLRNPWRFSLDRATGDLYIGDVGENLHEEIDVEPGGGRGSDYGWPIMEGLQCFDPPASCPMGGLTLPVLEYGHDEGCAVTGGFVYRGCAMPDLRGTYFYGDYCRGFVRSFVYAGGAATQMQERTADLAGGAPSGWQVSSFGEDARGELYICDLRGAVYKIVPN